MQKYILIDKVEDFNNMIEQIKDKKVLGVDLECENNLHYYGIRLALVQIFDGINSYIVDAVLLKGKISALKKIFEDKNVVKIFHNIDFDFRMLHDKLDCRPENIYDTQLAAEFLNKPRVGLKHLLEEYFHVKKEEKFQKADWIKRPMTDGMLEYASKDTLYLIKLREILTKELKEVDKFDMYSQYMEVLIHEEYENAKIDYIDIKGAKRLERHERGILKEIFKIREKLAKEVNRPTYFLFSNRRMLELVKNPPKTLEDWKKIPRSHPVVRRNAHKFFFAVKNGKQHPISYKIKNEYGPLSQKEQNEIVKISLLREEIAQKYDIKPHFVIRKKDMVKIVKKEDLSFLTNWQKEKLLNIKE
jgi:ribonuclease D